MGIDINEITQIIGSVGFPIVACIFMGWLYVKLVETLQELTLAINTLTTKFDSHIDNVRDKE